MRRADRRFFNLETTLADAISAAQPIPFAETANSMFPGCCAKTMLAMYDNKTPTPKTSSELRPHRITAWDSRLFVKIS